LIILAESRWTDGLNCGMKGSDLMIRTTGCEDIESGVKLVGRLQSGGWGCRSWGQGVRNRTCLFQHGVVLECLETIPTRDTVVQ